MSQRVNLLHHACHPLTFLSCILPLSLFSLRIGAATTLLSMFRHASLRTIQESIVSKTPLFFLLCLVRLLRKKTHSLARPPPRTLGNFTLVWSPNGKSLTKSFFFVSSPPFCHLSFIIGLCSIKDLVSQGRS